MNWNLCWCQNEKYWQGEPYCPSVCYKALVIKLPRPILWHWSSKGILLKIPTLHNLTPVPPGSSLLPGFTSMFTSCKIELMGSCCCISTCLFEKPSARKILCYLASFSKYVFLHHLVLISSVKKLDGKALIAFLPMEKQNGFSERTKSLQQNTLCLEPRLICGFSDGF